MDEEVGSIIEALTKRGIWNNTVIIFSTGIFRKYGTRYN
jgi:arylsulfatase A-like enzyme